MYFATPITETIATSVDGVTIIIGDSGTPTIVMPVSGDAITASIAGTSAAGDISILTALFPAEQTASSLPPPGVAQYH